MFRPNYELPEQFDIDVYVQNDKVCVNLIDTENDHSTLKLISMDRLAYLTHKEELQPYIDTRYKKGLFVKKYHLNKDGKCLCGKKNGGSPLLTLNKDEVTCRVCLSYIDRGLDINASKRLHLRMHLKGISCGRRTPSSIETEVTDDITCTACLRKAYLMGVIPKIKYFELYDEVYKTLHPGGYSV